MNGAGVLRFRRKSIPARSSAVGDIASAQGPVALVHRLTDNKVEEIPDIMTRDTSKITARVRVENILI